MPTSGIVIHYRRCGCQFSNSRKYAVKTGILCLICAAFFRNISQV